jgi:endonuclease/exonuclease/phosphatase family metal-dependent hydrolase
MRIVSWNCHYGFTNEKVKVVEKLKADILVIQECREDEYTAANQKDWHSDAKDSGGDKKKDLGIGIFCSGSYTVSPLFDKNDKNLDKSRYVLPYKIGINGNHFNLFAVWTKGGYTNYHEPVYNALDSQYEIFKAPDIIIGDFNTGSNFGTSSAHWYETLKRRMADRNLANCAAEQEWCPTFFRGNGNWLDDHCFATPQFKVVSFGIGNHDYWKQYSDHCPIIVDFDF